MKKGKQILWHKKSGKMVPSKFLQDQGKKAIFPEVPANSGNKLKDFARKLSMQIKHAAKDKE